MSAGCCSRECYKADLYCSKRNRVLCSVVMLAKLALKALLSAAKSGSCFESGVPQHHVHVRCCVSDLLTEYA